MFEKLFNLIKIVVYVKFYTYPLTFHTLNVVQNLKRLVLSLEIKN